MVEIDTKTNENEWVRIFVIRWAKKMGVHFLASLHIEMHMVLSTAKRKRTSLSLEDSVKLIELDENNEIKFNAKVSEDVHFSEIHGRIKRKVFQKRPKDIRNFLEKIEKLA